MNLTLIRPSELVTDSANALTTPPVGLAYLAAYVRRHGRAVRVIDGVGEGILQYSEILNARFGIRLHGLSATEIVDRIEPECAELIGVSCMFSQDWPIARDLIGLIRARFPNAVIVCGGEHVTAMPEHALRDCRAIDFAVLREGEATLLELVERLERLGLSNKGPFKAIAGLAFLDAAGGYFEAPPRPRIADLDTVPYPAWDLVPIEAYLASGSGFGVSKGRNMPIVASRGCPYACTFCSNRDMWGGLWRARDPIKVVDEIEYYHRSYAAANFDFYDLTMVVRKDWIMAFCEELERRRLDITYQLPSGTRSEAIDEEVAKALNRTGCCHIVYAPESGSERTLERVNKRIKLDRAVRSMKAAVRAGTFVKMNIVIGFPGETHRDVLRTCRLLLKTAWIGVQDVFVYTFTPYPGTALFRELSDAGQIGAVCDDFFYSLTSYIKLAKAVSYAERISSRALAFYRFAGLSLFYLASFAFHPGRIVRIIRNLLSRKTDTRVDQFIRSLLRPSSANTHGLVLARRSLRSSTPKRDYRTTCRDAATVQTPELARR